MYFRLDGRAGYYAQICHESQWSTRRTGYYSSLTAVILYFFFFLFLEACYTPSLTWRFRYEEEEEDFTDLEELHTCLEYRGGKN